MRNIVYYVAVSLDGYIMGPDEDMGAFVAGGSGVEKYLSDLQQFDTVIMGRNTYTFGYRFGLQPGKKAYPHMTHYIFSHTLQFEHSEPGVHLCPLDPEIVRELKKQSGTDIYLCGGGRFAGWLLDHGLIDELRIKLNPVVLGEGVRLFGASRRTVKSELLSSTIYDHGLQIMSFKLLYDQDAPEKTSGKT